MVIDILHREYPLLFMADNMIITASPFGNCQSFTVGYAYSLNKLEDDDLNKCLNSIMQVIKDNNYGTRTQMIIDLQECSSKSLIPKLEKISKNIYSTPYISTNKSNMVMHIIQLDLDKLK